jgi:hypothetical protein
LEVVEAVALVWNSEDHDAVRLEQDGSGLKEGDEIGRVFNHMASYEGVESAMKRLWYCITQRSSGPNEIHLLDTVNVDPRLASIMRDQSLARCVVQSFRIPASGLGRNRTIARPDFNDVRIPGDWGE